MKEKARRISRQAFLDYFFLCLFKRKRFLRLWVDILCLLCFFPFGITLIIFMG